MFRCSYCRQTITYFPLVTRQLAKIHYFLEILIAICTLGESGRDLSIIGSFCGFPLQEVVGDCGGLLLIIDHQWLIFFSPVVVWWIACDVTEAVKELLNIYDRWFWRSCMLWYWIYYCDLVFTDSNGTLRNKTKQTVSYAFSLLSFARLAAFASGFAQHFGVLSSSLSLF